MSDTPQSMLRDIMEELRHLNGAVANLQIEMHIKITEIEARLSALEQSGEWSQAFHETNMLFRDYTQYLDDMCYTLEKELNQVKSGFRSVIIIGDNKNESNIP